MRRLHFAAWIFSVGLMVLGASVVAGQTTSTGSGQAYPNKAIRLVTGEAGGGNDIYVRFIMRTVSTSLGQNIIVENRPTTRFVDIMAQAPPDGYTLLVGAGSLWIDPLLQRTSYDPARDLAPVTMLARSPNVLVVHPSLPVKSVQELIALIKAKPGELNFASGGSGSSPHLAAELFKAMAGGLNMVHVPYKGSGPALNDLIGAHVQLMFPNMAAAAPHIKSGKLRALAIATVAPSALAPALPTVAAAGLPGFESAQKSGMFAPLKTPAAIVNRLNQEVVRVLNQPDMKEKFLSVGAETVGDSPEQFTAAIRSEMARIAKVIKDAGISVQ